MLPKSMKYRRPIIAVRNKKPNKNENNKTKVQK